MMMSPDEYIEMQKKKTFRELMQEKEELLNEIAKLEKVLFVEGLESEEWWYDPGPDVQYQCNLEYLAELCNYMSEMYRKCKGDLDKNLNKTVIFYYSVNRWFNFTSNSKLEVYEEDGKYYAEFIVPDEKGFPKEGKIELDEEIIEKINDIYSRNSRIFSLEYNECPPVFDGCSHVFIFGDEYSENEISASNLWYYEKEKDEASEDTKLLLDTFKKIRNILIEAGVDEACLKLR